MRSASVPCSAAHARTGSSVSSNASGRGSAAPSSARGGHGLAKNTYATSLYAPTDAWLTHDARIATRAAPDSKGVLENALDNLAVSGEPFLGQFNMLSSAHRREGGQGVVQVCAHVHWEMLCVDFCSCSGGCMLIQAHEQVCVVCSTKQDGNPRTWRAACLAVPID
jgi:hypothetical protein